MGGAGHLQDSSAQQAQQERELTIEFLRLVNASAGTRDLIRAATTFFQQQSGCDAVGVRLREGDDYPYYEARGFPAEFVLAENSLCARDAAGRILRDGGGHPVIECMCGNVICGRFDPSQPFFTARGSFWTNGTTALLASTTEADRQARTRNRCNGEGYESVALLPLRLGEQRLGLLQLNARRPGVFSPAAIGLWEHLADQLAVALAKCRAEEALRASETRYRSLFEHMLEGLAYCRMVFDEDDQPQDFIYLDVNSAFERLTGLKDVVGKKVTEVLPGIRAAHPELFEIYGRVALTGQPERFEVHMEALGVWLSISVYRNAERCFVAIFDNITARKQAEAEKQTLEAQVRQQQKLEAIGTLASGVAHEINNPLTGIMNYAQLICDGLTPDTSLQNYAREIMRETDRVSAIVRALLTFARRERQAHSPARLADIIAATLSLSHAALRHDEIVVEVDLSPDLPAIQCRSQQVQQVLMNLLTNARDALNERYPGADENKRIRITARPFTRHGQGWVRTTVEDRGNGIAPEIRDRVFDPFFTTKPKDKGTGLGLSISHGIVEEHHGTLHMETAVGQYTRFHLDLPADGGARSELTPQDAVTGRPEGSP